MFLQPKTGYRYSIDSLLLARLTRPKRKILFDLGAGCGVVGLTIKLFQNIETLYLVEIQNELASYCQKNKNMLGLSGVNIVVTDVRYISKVIKSPPEADVVLNPPFYEKGGGRLPRFDGEKIARHSDGTTLFDFFNAARYLVGNAGSVSTIFPSRFLARFFRVTYSVGLFPSRMIPIYSRKSDNSILIFLELCRNQKRETVVEKPIILHKEDGGYTTDIDQFIQSLKSRISTFVDKNRHYI